MRPWRTWSTWQSITFWLTSHIWWKKWNKISTRPIHVSLLLAHESVERSPFWLEKSFRISSKVLGRRVAYSERSDLKPISLTKFRKSWETWAPQTATILYRGRSNNSKRSLTPMRWTNCDKCLQWETRLTLLIDKTCNSFTMRFSRRFLYICITKSEFDCSLRSIDLTNSELSLVGAITRLLSWRFVRIWTTPQMRWGHLPVGSTANIPKIDQLCSPTRGS